MVAFTLRQAARASPARLVAGMRVSLASSSASSCFARSIVSKTSNVMNVGVRAFSGSARRFGSGTSEFNGLFQFNYFGFFFICSPHSLSFGIILVFNCTDLFSCKADISLSQKLKEELQYEQDSLAETSDATPEFLKTFLEQGIWSVRGAFFSFSFCND